MFYYGYIIFDLHQFFSRMQVGHQTRDGCTCIGGSSVLVTVRSVKCIVTCETSGPCDCMAEWPSLL